MKKKISLVIGTFNVLHAGHIRLLKYAKEISDYLIVAVNSDKSDSNKSLVKQKLRLENLKSLDWVDKSFIWNRSVYELIKKYRQYGLNLSNLVFMQVESPLRDNDFFIKKVCLSAKNKSKIIVGNINTYRDYSWITEVVKVIILASNFKSKDFMISAGKKFSGKEILASAYKLKKLDYNKYFSINKKFFRKNEEKTLIGSAKNTLYLKKKFKILSNTNSQCFQ